MQFLSENTELIAMVGCGSAGGLFGGMVAAVIKQQSRREQLACVLGGFGIGTFLAPGAVLYYKMHPFVAGAIGFVGGVAVNGVISVIQLLPNKWFETKFPNKPSPGGDPS